MWPLAIASAVLSFASTSTALLAEGNVTQPLTSRLILPKGFVPPQDFENVNLVRLINLEKSYPRESTNVMIENVASSPKDEYYLPFKPRQMETLAALEVKDQMNPDGDLLEVQAVDFDPASEIQFYRIRLPEPLAPNARQTLGITYSYLSALSPLPAAIEQSDKQYLVYEFSAYFQSPYETRKQETEVKLPGLNVREYTIMPASSDSPESPRRQGSKLTYGPYSGVPAGAHEPVSVRYEFTNPLIHVSRLERDIEVSHWGGNVAFEERYTMHNRAANLTKQFSRVAWASQAYYNPATTALRDLNFPLRVGSLTPYFTDVIGNVSTSRFRSNKREANLLIKPRYPVFGGWNYPFRVGWDADLKKFLRKLKTGDGYVLNVPFLEGPKQPEGVEYKHVELRVILPEGAENVQYSTTVPLVSAGISLHRTFMDTTGRTSLTLTALNIVDDVRDRELIVTYDYPLLAGLRKPLVIFTSCVSLFLAAWAIGSLDVSIRGK
ncbi:uncharacterized protein L3040_009415 [Drepanopeziza brunnea f. sp. 'multigermtubi']|uniref:Dolichyl-diphosphooligosaccharide--protein glycosyltransferase subunit 1 n=1 Tax=Marssonina brunnea f. sp. multigermtubi (strain MB_m1) TaxID=1072389 RepID=K1W4Q1_MARBU|nr:oligosaccharyltransferase alpha subunit [Drepanopeziza brunnea f. sp. 'multigermtubi' MB_m1]EKD11925.1 oligosaccharyltransferase alpha subunit [Drepanopeziza brunnea f. sp. 'multigermtubi' MB_m1]KAJ5032824.1 hypothetical protein L3040_009415 [Drepanopeziza brunnea f. sp. 'multigermtubi']